MGNILASMVASDSAPRRDWTETAKAKRKELGQPRLLTDEQLNATRKELANEMPVTAWPGSMGRSRVQESPTQRLEAAGDQRTPNCGMATFWWRHLTAAVHIPVPAPTFEEENHEECAQLLWKYALTLHG